MKTYCFSLLLILFSCYSRADAQFSGYLSAGTGFNRNPLYNYAKASDQLRQSFIDLSYESEHPLSRLDFHYIGGLVLFNSLQDRNFYEHSFSGSYNIHLASGTAPPPVSEDSTEAGEDSSKDESDSVDVERISSFSDSTDSYVGLAARISARHDKVIFKDFNNQSGELSTSYRFPLGERSYARLSNTFALRSYSYITELSNINDLATIEFGWWPDSSFVYGVTGSAGYKYYTSSLYDTTRFETVHGFAQNPPGKGKPGGQQIGGNVVKDILVVPQANGTVQIIGGLFLRKDWSGDASLLSAILYRWMPRPAVRYIAQQSNTSLVTQDLYNDFFSYQGPEAKVQGTATLFLNIRLAIQAGFQYRHYSAPALTIRGTEIGKDRTDTRSSADFSLSRYFTLSGDIGFDITWTTEFLRNQSNDDYNDFSSYAVGISLGVNF